MTPERTVHLLAELLAADAPADEEALVAPLAEAGYSCEVKGRVKDISSIHAKMKSQDLELEQIYDAIGFRGVINGGSFDSGI